MEKTSDVSVTNKSAVLTGSLKWQIGVDLRCFLFFPSIQTACQKLQQERLGEMKGGKVG